VFRGDAAEHDGPGDHPVQDVVGEAVEFDPGHGFAGVK
jgi:hypothetical protein